MHSSPTREIFQGVQRFTRAIYMFKNSSNSRTRELYKSIKRGQRCILCVYLFQARSTGRGQLFFLETIFVTVLVLNLFAK